MTKGKQQYTHQYVGAKANSIGMIIEMLIDIFIKKIVGVLIAILIKIYAFSNYIFTIG